MAVSSQALGTQNKLEKHSNNGLSLMWKPRIATKRERKASYFFGANKESVSPSFQRYAFRL